jgi:hypothetical protein
MGDTLIVTRRRHQVVRAELLVALRQIPLCVVVEIAESSRKAIRSVVQWGSSHRPQSILQTFRQGDKALSAQNDVRMLKAGPDKSKVIKKMITRRTGDVNANAAHIGEVG